MLKISRKAVLRVLLAFIGLFFFYKIFFSLDHEGLANSDKLLGEKIQARIHQLQNPSVCNPRKLLLYDARVHKCSFGCSIHQLSLFFHLAYFTDRTLVIQNSDYLHFFRPYSNSKCDEWVRSNFTHADTKRNGIIDIRSPEIFIMFKGLAVKLIENSAKSLQVTNKNPEAFVLGQFTTYLMRYNDTLESEARSQRLTKEIRSDCVGVHVRRSDKIKEAPYHQLSEYMAKVKAHLSWLSFDLIKGFFIDEKKCVVLITDEVQVVQEAVEKYPGYRFVFEEERIQKNEPRKQSMSKLKNVILDLDMLFQCKFVVCTLSSNMGRLVYEKLATRFHDPAAFLISLDRNYTYN